MAKNNNLKDFLTGIANKLREYLYTTELINPQDFESKIAEAINTVGNNAYYSGIEEGKQAEYDKFWDSFQENGNKTNYLYAFSGTGWTDTTFKPKYNMKPTNAQYMFSENSIIHLYEILTEQNVEIDFSQCTNFNRMLMWSQAQHIPTVDTRSSSNINYIFFYASLVKTIDKLILKDDGSQTFSDAFSGCSSLIDITIEGIIGKQFNIHHCPKLSKKSIESIINALSETANGLTVQFSQAAVQNAFGISDITEESTWTNEYRTLRNSKSNWTIAYI